MSNCFQCGKRLHKEVQFCPHCGRAVSKTTGSYKRIILLLVFFIIVLTSGAFFLLNNAGIPLLSIFKDKLEQAQGFINTNAQMTEEEMKKFLIEADQLKYSIEYEIEEGIIGKCNNLEVFKISGEFADFNNVLSLLAPYFTPEVVANEVHRINLCVIENEVGAIREGQNDIPITDHSEFILLEDKPNLKQVQVLSLDATGRESNIEYTLEKNELGQWIITASSAINCRNKSKYITGWQFQASSIFSELVQGQNVTYYPERAFDFKMETAWVEGVSGDGIGEWISTQSEQEQIISGIELINGFAKSRETYFNNNRVKKILIEFSDGTSITKQLEDNNLELQLIEFRHEVRTTSLKITILEVYPGEKYADTCISEIRIFKRF